MDDRRLTMVYGLLSIITPASVPTRSTSHPFLFGRARILSLISRLRLALQMDSPIVCSDLLIWLQALRWYFQVPVIARSFFFPLLSLCSLYGALRYSLFENRGSPQFVAWLALRFLCLFPLSFENTCH